MIKQPANEIAVPSPCVRNCCLDDADICVGCYRTLEEIKDWATADNERRRVILQGLETRRARSSR